MYNRDEYVSKQNSGSCEGDDGGDDGGGDDDGDDDGGDDDGGDDDCGCCVRPEV